MKIRIFSVWCLFFGFIILFLLAILLLAGTLLGFVLAFGSGILGYECWLVIRKLRRVVSAQAEETVQPRIAI